VSQTSAASENPTMPTQIILVCHAPLASALHAVACHGFHQHLADVIAIDVLSEERKEHVCERIQAAWQEAGTPKAVLLLTDLHGATPSNGASLWLSSQAPALAAVAGVAGVSLPLLLKALTYKHLPPAALAAHLLESQADCGCRLEAL
jgi:PTS system ascorbate-specific IIA component